MLQPFTAWIKMRLSKKLKLGMWSWLQPWCSKLKDSDILTQKLPLISVASTHNVLCSASRPTLITFATVRLVLIIVNNLFLSLSVLKLFSWTQCQQWKSVIEQMWLCCIILAGIRSRDNVGPIAAGLRIHCRMTKTPNGMPSMQDAAESARTFCGHQFTVIKS